MLSSVERRLRQGWVIRRGSRRIRYYTYSLFIYFIRAYFVLCNPAANLALLAVRRDRAESRAAGDNLSSHVCVHLHSSRSVAPLSRLSRHHTGGGNLVTPNLRARIVTSRTQTRDGLRRLPPEAGHERSRAGLVLDQGGGRPAVQLRVCGAHARQAGQEPGSLRVPVRRWCTYCRHL